ncbi:hypothetical protein [Delftia acidovorans]|uniref:hypothetical protein n=1 Tax=Delftia acidovorans TaxID=80866 RepID=UPI001C0D3931|nr:hypothetical protein [Delftia acidovorans]
MDQMYGSGSGVLIRFGGKFFLLTAKHVIHNNIPGDFQNESPFWITSKFQSGWNSIYDFLFPKRIWYIGEKIENLSDTLDISDLCLVELFDPPRFHRPNHFIDIESRCSILGKDELFNGQILLVTGYPFERNTFDYTPVSEEVTHTTSLHRYTVPGIFAKDEDFGFIKFCSIGDTVRHSNVNGMSGGAVYNVHLKANQVKLAGIPVSAGDNICRFIPSHAFIDSLLNYSNSRSRIVDPIAENEPPLEDRILVYFKYMKDFYPKFPINFE